MFIPAPAQPHAHTRHHGAIPVVPCCVFQDLFPLRVIETKGSGGRQWGSVKSYNSFVRYLLAKKSAFGSPNQVAVLPFVGKNRVVYSPVATPGSPPRPDTSCPT